MPAYNTFSQFGLGDKIESAVNQLGYVTPTPIQQSTIPYIMAGEDIIGQAQTGTGKTAAFALPLLSLINPDSYTAQALILVPTRELALQVAKALQDYAKNLKSIIVATIFGGDSYRNQIKDLRDGAQIIVATPGRMMDHMRRQTIDFSSIEKVVLDEADEMLKMGFIEDIEWILEQTPNRNHTALFSATMPKPIKKIALKYLNNPKSIIIKSTENQANKIKQSYVVTPNKNKFMKLNRILETAEINSAIIFTRTKALTEDVTDNLLKNNYKACALNGDMPQALRKKTIEKIKNGDINILVATDVAARGLDIDSITHVINYDSPHDFETYTHRIGRTGRAGREGNAILFLTPNEKYWLREIEAKSKKEVVELELPSNQEINELRLNKFKTKISSIIQLLDNSQANPDASNKNTRKNLEYFSKLIHELKEEHDLSGDDIALALAMLKQMESPILMESTPKAEKSDTFEKSEKSGKSNGRSRNRDRNRDRDRNRSRSRNSDRDGDRNRSRGKRDDRGRDRDSSRDRDRNSSRDNDRNRSNSKKNKR